MHIVKNNILALLLAMSAVFFAACAGTAENNGDAVTEQKTYEQQQNAGEKDAKYQERLQDKQAMLESMFANFLDAVRNNASAEVLYEFLTDTSEYWLDTLENHARSYDADALDTCQFYEAYAIILYRLYEREHLWETDDDRMLFLFLSKSGMLERFTQLNLGPLEYKNDRGSVGLASSPKVPIMLFEWDDTAWKLNLPETLPLITKGIESIAVKKKWTNRKLALYWIEKEYHMTYSRLDESLLDPIF